MFGARFSIYISATLLRRRSARLFAIFMLFRDPNLSTSEREWLIRDSGMSCFQHFCARITRNKLDFMAATLSVYGSRQYLPCFSQKSKLSFISISRINFLSLVFRWVGSCFPSAKKSELYTDDEYWPTGRISDNGNLQPIVLSPHPIVILWPHHPSETIYKGPIKQEEWSDQGFKWLWLSRQKLMKCELVFFLRSSSSYFAVENFNQNPTTKGKWGRESTSLARKKRMKKELWQRELWKAPERMERWEEKERVVEKPGNYLGRKSLKSCWLPENRELGTEKR